MNNLKHVNRTNLCIKTEQFGNCMQIYFLYDTCISTDVRKPIARYLSAVQNLLTQSGVVIFLLLEMI